jgi:hypothetical protein
MTQPLSHQELLERFQSFSHASIKWCIAESEASTSAVSSAIDQLMAKAERVSKISAAGLVALKAAKKTLDLHKGPAKYSQVAINSLINSLQGLSREHEEVRGIINPIIENLQYQDRLRQRLENISKMTHYWTGFRKPIVAAGGLDDHGDFDVLGFAQGLAKLTTSVEERDILRRHFKELPTETRVDDSVTLF